MPEVLLMLSPYFNLTNPKKDKKGQQKLEKSDTKATDSLKYGNYKVYSRTNIKISTTNQDSIQFQFHISSKILQH